MARSPKHLAFIRQLPCCICLNNVETEACHLRISRPGKYQGTGLKPGDEWTTPMCSRHHRIQTNHPGGEKRFWANAGIDPFDLAEKLWAASGDAETAEQIIRSLHYE